MYQLVILDAARQEWLDAAVYYELQQTGLGEKFSEVLQQHIKLIQESPKHFQKTKKEYREAGTPPFPFVVVLRIDTAKNTVVIVPVFHTKESRKLNTIKNNYYTEYQRI